MRTSRFCFGRIGVLGVLTLVVVAGWGGGSQSSVVNPENIIGVIAPGRGDGVNRIYAGSRTGNGQLDEFTWNGTSWTPVVVSTLGVEFVYRARARNDGVDRLYGSEGGGEIWGGIWEVNWTGSTWTVVSISTWGVLRAVGDGRNDGLVRLYVTTQTAIQELSWVSGSWQFSSVGVTGGTAPVDDLAIGPGRSDGENRLYAATRADRQLHEFSWTGSSWTGQQVADFGSIPLSAWSYEGGQWNRVSAVTVGDARGDGMKRVYMAWQSGIAECTWQGTGFTTALVAGDAGGADLLIGAVRSPTQPRLYAGWGSGQRAVIDEYTWSGAWSRSERMPMSLEGYKGGLDWGGPTVVGSLAIGQGRNDGVTRLYGGAWLYTLTIIPEVIEGAAEFSYSPPVPSGSLTGTSSGGRTISLAWTRSTSPDVGWYRVYWDGGTGIINYAAPIATLAHPATTWTSGPLTDGGTYKFAVRVMDIGLTEETNTTRVVSVMARQTPRQAQAIIKVPRAGRKIAGNRVTVVAELLAGTPSQVTQVEFQYRSSGAVTWQTISAADQARHPNPDSTSPYFIHWDVTGLAVGDYDLRAVATDRSFGRDPEPPSVTVRVDPSGAEIEERRETDGRLVKRERVDNSEDSEVVAGDEDGAGLTRLTLPAGSLAASSVTVRLVLNPMNVPDSPAGRNPIGVTREITLENGQTDLQGRTATLELPYRDDDDDLAVDGTGVPVRSLKGHVYEPTLGWVPTGTSTVDATAKRVRFTTPHLSLFALLGAPADTLDGIKVYPNPFKPTSGLGHTQVIFDNLTTGAQVRMFTLLGDMVWETGPTDLGQVRWNGQNASGKDAAPGLYLYAVTNPKGEKRRGKLVIVR